MSRRVVSASHAGEQQPKSRSVNRVLDRRRRRAAAAAAARSQLQLNADINDAVTQHRWLASGAFSHGISLVEIYR